jgi:hypothetical protein
MRLSLSPCVLHALQLHPPCNVEDFTAVNMKTAIFWDVMPTDVSEERIFSVIKVKRNSELGTTVAVTTMLLLLVTANVVPSSLILLTLTATTATPRHFPEGDAPGT